MARNIGKPAGGVGSGAPTLGGLKLAGASTGFSGQKPDGTSYQPAPFPSHLKSGIANRITLKLPEIPVKPTTNIKDGKSNAYSDPNKPATVQKNLTSIVTNPLEQFSSYTPLWTMACIDRDQFNDPTLYRDNPSALTEVIISSAGRYDSQRTRTASGVPEYFIDNFRMSSTIAPNQKSGNQNVFKFEFEVYEPYSMGLFLQSLQIAARRQGYVNYLQNAPYLLQLDFKGYDETGKLLSSVKPKYFVLKLTKSNFEVEESGSRYQIEAVPYNSQGFSDVINTAFNDIKLVAGEQGTVLEILKTGKGSLVEMLNENEKRLKDAGLIGVTDVYDIQFPTKSSEFSRYKKREEPKSATADPKASITNPTVDFKNAPSLLSTAGGSRQSAQTQRITQPTVDTRFVPSILQSGKYKQSPETINSIGNSSLGFGPLSGGNFAFKKYNEVIDEESGKINRDQVVIDPKKRAFQFAQQQTLTTIIEQVLLNSDYSKSALDPKNLTPQGFVKWFKIDVQIELLEKDPIIGDYAKKITYRIVPYYVHSSIFQNPNSMPVGYSEIQQLVAKEYNYIYTGQNSDVLDFKIDINHLFYTGINSSDASQSGYTNNQDLKGVGQDLQKGSPTQSGQAEAAQFANLGRSRTKRDPKLLQSTAGGNKDKTTEQLVAESFNNALKTGASADLIQVELDVLGDTYWLIDSGMGNYFAPYTSEVAQITNDGTANYENGFVYIYITFKTPNDIDETTGLYSFKKENQFSGLYRVTKCDSTFNGGKFTQKLQCIRMTGQAIDYQDTPVELQQQLIADRNTIFATDLTEEQKERITVTDNVVPNILQGTGSVSPKATEGFTITPDLLKSQTSKINRFGSFNLNNAQTDLTSGGNPFAGLPAATGENSLDGGSRLLGGGR